MRLTQTLECTCSDGRNNVAEESVTTRLGPLTLDDLGGEPFGTILADPPWRFMNRTGKVAPEHGRLSRYDTMAWEQIAELATGVGLGPTHL